MHGDFSIESGAAAAERLLGRARAAHGHLLLQRRNGDGGDRSGAPLESARAEQLSVVGFDDIRFARHMAPPLTTIAQPMRQIGEGTVRLLLGILAGGGDAETPESVTLPHKLVVRESTAPPPEESRKVESGK